MTTTSPSERPLVHLTREELLARCHLLGDRLRAERQAREMAERVALYAIARLERVRHEIVGDIEQARRTLHDGQTRTTTGERTT